MVVEHLARIAQAPDANTRPFEILVIPRQALHGGTTFVFAAAACDSTVEIEYVEFCVRVAQQVADIAETACVPQTNRVPAVADGPVRTLLAKKSVLRGTDESPRVLHNGRVVSG